MDERNSLRWAGFVLTYGPRFAPITAGVLIVLCSLVFVWRGIALGWAIESLSQVRATPLSFHAQTLTRGWGWARADFTPAPLAVGSVEVLSAVGNTQWIGELTNSNAEWIARALVRFSSDSLVTDGQWVTVLPNGVQPVIVGNRATSGISVQLVVDDVQWQHIGTVKAFARVRESPIRLLSAKASTDVKDPSVTIEIENSGSLGYRDLLMLIRWEEGRRVTGAAVVPIEVLAPQQRRQLVLRVDHPIAGYAQYRIDPLIDLTDVMHYFVPQVLDAER